MGGAFFDGLVDAIVRSTKSPAASAPALEARDRSRDMQAPRVKPAPLPQVNRPSRSRSEGDSTGDGYPNNDAPGGTVDPDSKKQLWRDRFDKNNIEVDQEPVQMRGGHEIADDGVGRHLSNEQLSQDLKTVFFSADAPEGEQAA